MTEAEKESIEQLKSWREYIIKHKETVNKANDIEFYLRTAINLIQKQDTEINKLNNVIDKIKDITRWLIIIPSRDKEGDYRPIKNTTAQECYKALAEIKEIMKEDK